VCPVASTGAADPLVPLLRRPCVAVVIEMSESLSILSASRRCGVCSMAVWLMERRGRGRCFLPFYIPVLAEGLGVGLLLLMTGSGKGGKAGDGYIRRPRHPSDAQTKALRIHTILYIIEFQG
jgi:hypothetical protein